MPRPAVPIELFLEVYRMAISKASGTGSAMTDGAGSLESAEAAAASDRRVEAVRALDEDTGAAVPSSVIHELRTPLTAIHGYAQVLHRSLASDPTKARATNVLLAESTRLSALLNQLSELAEVDSKSSERQASQVDVRQLVDGLVEQQAKKAADHTFEVDGTAVVRTDARRLAQALAHLLDNAVAYSTEGGTIRIRIVAEPEGAYVSIADEGIGVPPEDADRIFQPYRRGSNAKRAGVRGLGIGLYVARRAILREGGQIWHTPAEGKGTVFHLTVPNS